MQAILGSTIGISNLDDPAIRVLLIANSSLAKVFAILLALVEDVINIISSNATVHVIDILFAVVAQVHGRVVRAGYATAKTSGGAAGDATAEVALTVDEFVALLGLFYHRGGFANNSALEISLLVATVLVFLLSSHFFKRREWRRTSSRVLSTLPAGTAAEAANEAAVVKAIIVDEKYMLGV